MSHLSAKVGVQQVTLSDGSRAKLCKVGDEWWVHHQDRTHRAMILEAGTDDSQISDGSLVAPMPGTILDIMVTHGESVSSGQPLLLMEAMKMEHKIVSPSDGTIENLLCNIGDRVDQGAVLIVVARCDSKQNRLEKGAEHRFARFICRDTRWPPVMV